MNIQCLSFNPLSAKPLSVSSVSTTAAASDVGVMSGMHDIGTSYQTSKNTVTVLNLLKTLRSNLKLMKGSIMINHSSTTQNVSKKAS